MRKTWIYIIALLFIPSLTHAGVVITEIMYDVSGTDTDREWIEVFNEGPDPVTLIDWKLFENDTNHKIQEGAGGLNLSVDEYVIIADNTEKFKVDNPGYSGKVFKSVFSLNNSGESLEIRTPDDSATDIVVYSGDWGADGNGLSLQKNRTKWIAAYPTPGASNASQEVIIEEPVSTEEEVTEQQSSGSTSKVKKPEKKYISTEVTGAKTAIVGADVSFIGQGYGFEGEILEGAEYLWNFGDGYVEREQETSHIFRHPGEYVVVLDVSVDKYAASDRILLKALPADIVISSVEEGKDGFIEIQNNTGVELDLSGWILSVNGVEFNLPKNTLILPGKKNKYPYDSTKLYIIQGSSIRLHYPNSGLVTSFDWSKNEVEEVEEELNDEVKIAAEDIPKVVEEVSEHISKLEADVIIESPEPDLSQTAIALEAVSEKSKERKSESKLLLLVLLIGAGMGSVYFLREKEVAHSKSEVPLEDLTPEDFEIID